MSKFGEIIDKNKLVLLFFFAEWNKDSVRMQAIIRDVAAMFGNKADIVKIDVDKNVELVEALRIKGLPTFMLYKNGRMDWRESGVVERESLIGAIQNRL